MRGLEKQLAYKLLLLTLIATSGLLIRARAEFGS